jgi:hypothetical protein
MIDWMNTPEGEASLDKHFKMLRRQEEREEQFGVYLNGLSDADFKIVLHKIIDKSNNGRCRFFNNALFETAAEFGVESTDEDSMFMSYCYEYRGLLFRRYDGQGSVYTISDSTDTLYDSMRY